MNNYGKHHPNKNSKTSSKDKKGSGNVGENKSTGSKTGIQLTTLNEENESSSDHGSETESNVKTSRGVLKKSTRRLIDAIFPQVGSSHKTFRAIWILIYVALIAVFSIYLHGIVMKYLSFPTSTEMTIETTTSIDFPAVTICNENPILKSKISRLRKYADLQALDKYTQTFMKYSAQGIYNDVSAKQMKCPAGFFKCEEDGNCIPDEWKCEDVINCSDESDEDNNALRCEEIKANRLDKAGKLCVDDFIECNDSSNVIVCAKECDGVQECADRNDEDCENVTTAYQTPKYIESKNYPENYPNNYFWSTVIRSYDNISSIVIKIHEMYLEYNDHFQEKGPQKLCYDYLLWFEGELTSADFDLDQKVADDETILCGRHTRKQPKTINTNRSSITLFFVTDVSTPSKGFRISYQVDPSNPDTNIPHNSDGFDPVGDLPSFWTQRYYLNNKFENVFYNFTNNYFTIYKASTQSDYSDFRDAVRFDRNSVWHYGQRKTDFIVQCLFRGEKCEMSAFEEYDDPTYGKCFTFKPHRNMDSLKSASINRAGKDYGLKLTLFIDADEYIGLLAPNLGARVAIHDPEIEPIMRTQSIAAAAGEATFLDIRAQQIERKGKDYSKCWNDWPEFLNLSNKVTQKWKYSTDSCLKYCVLFHIANECMCIESFDRDFSTHPNISSVSRQCSHENYLDRECRFVVIRRFKNFHCDCRTPCNSTEYFPVASRSPWPSAAYSSYFATRVIKESNRTHPKFRDHLLKVANESQGDLKFIHQKIRENFVRLEIFYSSLRIRKISESASYDFMDLLGDFGGNIGLWLGWSVFALFEILIFFLHVIESILICDH